MFQPVEGKQYCVRDPETGIEMWLRSVHHNYAVHVRLADGKEFQFGITLEPKYPDKPFTGPSPSYPMIRILMGSLNQAAIALKGSFDENTELVAALLRGLSAINKIWSLGVRSPFFYGDAWRYVGQEHLFPFRLPSDEELARL